MQDYEVLARRALVCKHWKWMRGMSWIRLPFNDIDEGDRGVCMDGVNWDFEDKDMFIPDLTDPATLGCLEQLVKDAYGISHIWVEVRYGQRARVVSPEHYSEGIRMLSDWCVGTKPEALIVALEMADVRYKSR